MLKNINKSEILIYAIGWAIVFMVPLAQTESSDGSVWSDLIDQWKDILPFLILFIIHNVVGVYILLRRRMMVGYTLTVLALLFAFFLYTAYSNPHIGPGGPNSGHAPFSAMHRPPHPDGMRNEGMPDIDDTMDMALDDQAMLSGDMSQDEMEGNDMLQVGEMNTPPTPKEKIGKTPDGIRDHKMPIRFMGPKLSHMIMAILMISANMAVYLFFRQREDEERLRNLEKEQLKQELEYLKYQVNPHFFMNTLNNIHALVDIDSEKAKTSIVELSRLMRYMLYDGSAEHVPVSREIDFLNHYVRLMQLRYDDTVDVSIDTPHEIPYMEIPPLLFISFVENAFKHGISYQQDSFIHIKMGISDDKVITFVCDNSKCIQRPTLNNAPQQKIKESGIGLENVRKRLSLLFPSRHTLSITETETEFQVRLEIKC